MQRYVKDRQWSRFRSQSDLRDRQGSRFRSQSGFGRQQSKSQERSKSHDRPKSELAKKVDVIETELKETNNELKETKKLIVEMRDEMKKMAVNSNFVEEEYAADVRYVDELDGLIMIVDS